jgi:ADP-heptose:LPS heptosyltransferase
MTPVRAAFRQSRNYYLALLTELAAPAMSAAARLRSGNPSPASSWRTGLIIGHTHIGDVLYRTASLPHLAQTLPQCKWYYLCSDESAAVLSGRRDIAGVLPLVTGEDSWTLEPDGFDTLLSYQFDVALCTNTLRHYPDLLLSIALGIPNRVGYSYKGLSGLMTTAITFDYPSPFPAYFRTMVSTITGTTEHWDLRPTIALSAADTELADNFLAGLELNGAPILACCPATRQSLGAWPADQLVDAAEQAAGPFDARVVLCGGPGDRPLLESLAARTTVRCDILAGMLPLKSFAAFLSRCAVVLAQDSAPRHLANAVRTPVVFLRNISVSRVETGTYCETELDAAPEDERVTEDRFNEVVAKRPPNDIAEHVVRLIASRALRT